MCVALLLLTANEWSWKWLATHTQWVHTRRGGCKWWHVWCRPNARCPLFAAVTTSHTLRGNCHMTMQWSNMADSLILYMWTNLIIFVSPSFTSLCDVFDMCTIQVTASNLASQFFKCVTLLLILYFCYNLTVFSVSLCTNLDDVKCILALSNNFPARERG